MIQDTSFTYHVVSYVHSYRSVVYYSKFSIAVCSLCSYIHLQYLSFITFWSVIDGVKWYDSKVTSTLVELV